jgi:Fic family protein
MGSYTLEEIEFLKQSNNIEDEWDDQSLWDALLAWEFCKQQKGMSVEVVLETHRLLMKSRDTLEDKDKGHFRTYQVWIGGHEAKPFYAVENLTKEWCDRINKSLTKREGKEILSVGFHVQYEAIHPFGDGNGRTGRIFYNWHRLKLKLPIHVIHTGKEQYSYYKWFQ